MDKINLVIVINVANNLFNNLYIMGKHMIICVMATKGGEEGIIFHIYLPPIIDYFSPFPLCP